MAGAAGATITTITTKDLQMPRVKREPSLTEKTQTWLEIRKAVPVMKRVGINPVEVKKKHSQYIWLNKNQFADSNLVPRERAR